MSFSHDCPSNLIKPLIFHNCLFCLTLCASSTMSLRRWASISFRSNDLYSLDSISRRGRASRKGLRLQGREPKLRIVGWNGCQRWCLRGACLTSRCNHTLPQPRLGSQAVAGPPNRGRGNIKGWRMHGRELKLRIVVWICARDDVRGLPHQPLQPHTPTATTR